MHGKYFSQAPYQSTKRQIQSEGKSHAYITLSAELGQLEKEKKTTESTQMEGM